MHVLVTSGTENYNTTSAIRDFCVFKSLEVSDAYVQLMFFFAYIYLPCLTDSSDILFCCLLFSLTNDS